MRRSLLNVLHPWVFRKKAHILGTNHTLNMLCLSLALCYIHVAIPCILLAGLMIRWIFRGNEHFMERVFGFLQLLNKHPEYMRMENICMGIWVCLKAELILRQFSWHHMDDNGVYSSQIPYQTVWRVILIWISYLWIVD